MSMFALIDGNNFYASCEMAFNPELWNRPVVVLSNNDGCIVSANALAKKIDFSEHAHHQRLGVHGFRSAKANSMMFQPYFKVKNLLEKNHTAVFSSNYELYADMSNRMHAVTAQFAPQQEIYSIDESFLNLSGMTDVNFNDLANDIRHTVFQWLHLPVAVGIAPTKTLAKLANHWAKQHADNQGVLNLADLSEATKTHLFQKTDVGKIWGVGSRLANQLKMKGIHTVEDLRTLPLSRVRKNFSITLERTVRELNGESCLKTRDNDDKKQIISSRSFGNLVTSPKDMEQALISHVAIASRKLRKQKSTCQLLTVYFKTSPFNKPSHSYCPVMTIPLDYPTDNTILLAKAAKTGLQKIWRAGYAYHKAGIVLSEITNNLSYQADLFLPQIDEAYQQKVTRMVSLSDELNHKLGKNSLYLLSEGIKNKTAWQMKRQLMSSRYTTHWDELLTLHV